MYRLRDKSQTPPHGFKYIDPETQFVVSARNYPNWIAQATDHRVANNLPLPDEADMEDQLCQSYDEKGRAQICQQYDASGAVPVYGVGATLKRMLAQVGVHACWGCSNLANKMDSWGPAGCEEHMAEIVEVMSDNANASKWMRYLPFKELGAEAIVRTAIAKVRLQG